MNLRYLNFQIFKLSLINEVEMLRIIITLYLYRVNSFSVETLLSMQGALYSYCKMD